VTFLLLGGCCTLDFVGGSRFGTFLLSSNRLDTFLLSSSSLLSKFPVLTCFLSGGGLGG
jgi:hypothetical protein